MKPALKRPRWLPREKSQSALEKTRKSSIAMLLNLFSLIASGRHFISVLGIESPYTFYAGIASLTKTPESGRMSSSRIPRYTESNSPLEMRPGRHFISCTAPAPDVYSFNSRTITYSSVHFCREYKKLTDLRKASTSDPASPSY